MADYVSKITHKELTWQTKILPAHPYQPVTERELRFIHLKGYRRNVNKAVIAAARRGVTGAMLTVTGDVIKFVSALAASLETKIGDESDLVREYQLVAEAAREAMLAQYIDEVEAKRLVNRYRSNDPPPNRYSGKLFKLLATAPSMAMGTADGVEFLDTELLASHARHWARLNYGAAPAPQHAAPAINITFQGTILERIKTAGPRPPFGMPKGFWTFEAQGYKGRSTKGSRRFRNVSGFAGMQRAVTGASPTHSFEFKMGDQSAHVTRPVGGFRNSVDKFFPLGKPQMYATRGIVGAHFVEAGLERMAIELDRAWSDLLDKWITEATPTGAAARGAAAGAKRFRVPKSEVKLPVLIRKDEIQRLGSRDVANGL